MDSEGPKVPKELQEKLTDALFEICMYLHDSTGSSQILISLQHVSDALARQSSSSISVMGGGIPIKRDPGSPSNAPQNKEQVDKVIEELMAKAKARGQEQRPSADQGSQGDK